jgi:hypothetical protein
MNVYYTGLSLPKNVFKENITVHDFPITRRTLLNPYLHLNPDIVKIINDAGLRIGQAELFYSPPGLVSGIHRDVPNSDISKINWVYHGSNSTMSWYDSDSKKKVTGPAGNEYKGYTLDEVTLLHSCAIPSPSLIQAGIAHNVINHNEPRWAVSLMLYYKDKFTQCPYSDALTRLKDYILPT